MNRMHLRTWCLAFALLAAAAASGAPSADYLLLLKADGLNEGERLQNASYCLELGKQALEAGKFGNALDLFNKCLELDSEKVEAHFHKGRLYKDDRVGLLAQAIAELKIYIASSPNDGWALAELGWAYRVKGKGSEAEETFKLATRKDPGNPGAWQAYGDFLVSVDRSLEGLEMSNTALARGADGPWPYATRARAYLNLGKWAKARADANKAVELARKMLGQDSLIIDMNGLLRSVSGK